MRDEDWKRRAQSSAKHAAESRGMPCLAVGAGRHSQARDEHLTHRAATMACILPTSTPRIFHRVFPPLNPSSRASSPQHAGGTATHLWKGVGQPRCGFALPSGTGEEIPTCPELALARASVVLAKMQKTEVTDIVSTALESLLQGEIENTGTPACALSI